MQPIEALSDRVSVRALALALSDPAEPRSVSGALLAPGVLVRWNAKRTCKEIHVAPTSDASFGDATLTTKVYNRSVVFYSRQTGEQSDFVWRMWQHLLLTYRSDFAFYRNVSTGRVGLLREAGARSEPDEQEFYDQLDSSSGQRVSLRVPLVLHVWQRAPHSRARGSPVLKQQPTPKDWSRTGWSRKGIDPTTAAGSMLA